MKKNPFEKITSPSQVEVGIGFWGVLMID